MKRLILALLLVLLVVLTVPPLRARAMPRLELLGAEIWKHLEGPLGPVLNPWRKVNTESEMSRITNAIMWHRNRGRPPPPPTTFGEFITSNAEDAEPVDAWGSPYRLDLGQDSIFVRSAGPDLTLDTPDDIVASLWFRGAADRARARR